MNYKTFQLILADSQKSGLAKLIPHFDSDLEENKDLLKKFERYGDISIEFEDDDWTAILKTDLETHTKFCYNLDTNLYSEYEEDVLSLDPEFIKEIQNLIKER